MGALSRHGTIAGANGKEEKGRWCVGHAALCGVASRKGGRRRKEEGGRRKEERGKRKDPNGARVACIISRYGFVGSVCSAKTVRGKSRGAQPSQQTHASMQGKYNVSGRHRGSPQFSSRRTVPRHRPPATVTTRHRHRSIDQTDQTDHPQSICNNSCGRGVSVARYKQPAPSSPAREEDGQITPPI